MWLEATLSPDFRNKVMSGSQYICHRPRAPMGCIGWFLRRCFRNNLPTKPRLCPSIVTYVVIASRQVIFHTGQSMLGKTLPPSPGHVRTDGYVLSYFTIIQAIIGQ